jgi:hypothetical protein
MRDRFARRRLEVPIDKRDARPQALTSESVGTEAGKGDSWQETRAFKRGAIIGALVLTCAGAAWAFIGLANREGTPGWAFGAMAVPELALLGFACGRLVALRRCGFERPSAEESSERRRGRKVGIWFGVIFLAECSLIAVAATGLARAGRYLLIPIAVAAIVGLHLVPIAMLLGIPVYSIAGLAIAGLAALSLLVEDERTRVYDVALVVAFALWASAGRVLARYAGPPERPKCG